MSIVHLFVSLGLFIATRFLCLLQRYTRKQIDYAILDEIGKSLPISLPLFLTRLLPIFNLPSFFSPGCLFPPRM